MRGLVVASDDRVLLVRWLFPDRAVWGLPGGGIEPGEDLETALRRELDEELGIGSTADIGARIWERTHLFSFGGGRWDGQHDVVFLVRTEPFTPRPGLSPAQLAAEHLTDIRWWEPDELLWFRPAATEFFAPRRLPELLAGLLADGPPPVTVDVGV